MTSTIEYRTLLMENNQVSHANVFSSPLMRSGGFMFHYSQARFHLFLSKKETLDEVLRETTCKVNMQVKKYIDLKAGTFNLENGYLEFIFSSPRTKNPFYLLTNFHSNILINCPGKADEGDIEVLVYTEGKDDTPRLEKVLPGQFTLIPMGNYLANRL